MEQKKPFYLTTTLPYVNADPHIGFALEIVQADILARYHTLMQREVFFTTGTDEHGQKIFQIATKEGWDVQEYVDHFAGQFGKLKDSLNLSYNAFIRTTEPRHIEAAQELWQRCLNNIGPDGPDIYKKKYKGLYCVGDEMFLKETDIVDGKCPNHPNMDPVEIEEENYFFRLSRYEKDLLTYLGREDSILPDWRRQEAIKFVSDGLEDFSISREKARMSWGIPVPGDETQVMYVWFDALTNYISTTGWPDTEGNFKKYWQEGEVVQVAGKDQVRFQSIMWQAMLMSGRVKNTDKIVYHGFITSGGQKMSKSLGNVIDPFAIVDEYGTDALRYFLARHVHPFDDSDVTMERFKDAYNADLANGLGNLVSRIMTMAEVHLVEPLKKEYLNEGQTLRWALQFLDSYDVSQSVNVISTRIKQIEQEISNKKPFTLIKDDKEKGAELIKSLVWQLWWVACWLEPVIPSTAEKIKQAIVENKKPENLFPRKD